jgi:hypothetical protein
LEDSLKLVILNCEFIIKLIYLARPVLLECLSESLDPITIHPDPVTCMLGTAGDNRSIISYSQCPAGKSLGLGDPSIPTSDRNKPRRFQSASYCFT